MPRKGSVVWKFFTKESDNKAICSLCNKACSTSGNTTNIANHLKSKHLDAFESLTNINNFENDDNQTVCRTMGKSDWTLSNESETIIENTISEKKPVIKKRRRKTNDIIPMSSMRKEESFNFKKEESFNFNNSFSSSDFETDLDIFGKSIAAQLKKLPEKKAVRITLQINNIIGQARLEDIEEQVANRSTSIENPHVITLSCDKNNSNADMPYL